MMITATFSYPHTMSQSIIQYPRIRKDLEKDGQKPGFVFITGNLDQNSIDRTRVIAWVHQMIAATVRDRLLIIREPLKSQLGEGPWQETDI